MLTKASAIRRYNSIANIAISKKGFENISSSSQNKRNKKESLHFHCESIHARK